VEDYLELNECNLRAGGSKSKRRGGGRLCDGLISKVFGLLKKHNQIVPNADRTYVEPFTKDEELDELFNENTSLPPETISQNNYEVFTILAQNLPKYLATVCNLNKAFERAIALPIKANLSEVEIITMNLRPSLKLFISKLQEFLIQNPFLGVTIRCGDIIIYSTHIYVPNIGNIFNDELKLIYPYYDTNSKLDRMLVRKWSYDPINTKPFSEIFRELDKFFTNKLEAYVEYPSFDDYSGCMSGITKVYDTYKTRKYHDILDKCIEELNKEIESKNKGARAKALVRFTTLQESKIEAHEGGSITYRKTTELFNHNGKNRVVWKKSTRKNSASFIKVKGKYVNIKTL
jgi:hypothetical protein